MSQFGVGPLLKALGLGDRKIRSLTLTVNMHDTPILETREIYEPLEVIDDEIKEELKKYQWVVIVDTDESQSESV